MNFTFKNNKQRNALRYSLNGGSQLRVRNLFGASQSRPLWGQSLIQWSDLVKEEIWDWKPLVFFTCSTLSTLLFLSSSCSDVIFASNRISTKVRRGEPTTTSGEDFPLFYLQWHAQGEGNYHEEGDGPVELFLLWSFRTSHLRWYAMGYVFSFSLFSLKGW